MFLITDIDDQDIILRINWLHKHNPVINWRQGIITLYCCGMLKHHTTVKRQRIKTTSTPKLVIPDDPEQDYDDPEYIYYNNPVYKIMAGFSKSQQLAINALDKRVKSFEEMVPKEHHKYKNTFSKEKSNRLPEHKPWDLEINLKEGLTLPKPKKAFQMSPHELNALKEFITQEEKLGRIQPSRSETSAPVFFIKKKDGGLRFVQDYRALNEVTVKNRYPIPLSSDLVDQLREAKYFTHLDLRNGYNNIRIKKGHEYKLAFQTPIGLYEPLVMYFGMTNAPGAFQALMNEIFRDLIMDNKVAVYLDDILIYSKTMKEHIEIVNEVLQRLQDNDLYLKPEKCEFHKTKTEFLGLIISEGNIEMDPIKLKGVADWPTPRKLKDVQGFMGFANFYRRFIQDFSEIARPLNNLTKKSVTWTWDKEHEAAFQSLKKKFIEAPCLKMPDPNKKYHLECDASNYATGAILSQQHNENWHLVAFQSKSFNETERNYEIHNKELAAIIRALEEWRHYLEGQGIPVEIWTDHKNLEYFMKAQNITRRQARWALFLSRFDFTLHHKPRKLSTKPDALSRRPDHFKNDADDNQSRIVLGPEKFKILATKRGQVTVLNERPLIKRIREEQVMEDDIRVAVQQVKKLGPKTLSKGLEDWNTEEGLLLYKGRIYVPNNKQLRADIVKIHHDGIATGHPGRHKTLELISQNYWWPAMTQFINEYIDGCDNCLRSKPKLHDRYKQLKPNETPERRWGTISMDFIMPLPKSQGYTGILVVVDRLTKMAHFCPVHKDITAMETTEKLMQEVFKHHGLPDKIISDRGSQFAAKVTQEMYNKLNITVALSTAYHPQTDGQTERVNQDLETYIRLFCNHRQNNWAKWLHLAEFAYNNKQHSTTKVSPFMANNLTEPRWQQIRKHVSSSSRRASI